LRLVGLVKHCRTFLSENEKNHIRTLTKQKLVLVHDVRNTKIDRAKYEDQRLRDAIQ